MTWDVIDNRLGRWTSEDLEVAFSKQRPNGTRTLTRGRLIWVVLEQDIHHASEISQILGSNWLPPLDM